MTTRVWCSVVMVPLASFMCMAQTSFFAQNFAQDSAGYTLMVLCTLLAFPAGFLLLARSEYPEATFWIACALVVVFPYDSLIALMAMTSLLARRSNRNTTIRATVGGTIVTLISQLRDALQQPKASIWHLIFAQPHTGGDSGSPMVMLVEEPTVIITATVASLVFVTIATLIGLHIRSRARLRTANAVASAATTHAATLQTDLTNQQLADAIAAEAHDTLAHSLSLMALNASALKAEAAKLGDSPEAQSLADKAEDIRRQSAGALDEAHSIIDMLRNPHQEGLTNARRHAPGAPVSLEVSATPQAGVHIHISNPIATDATETQRAHGAGLPGLAARVHSVNGQCRYGMDDRHLFHVDVQLPWRS